MLRGFALMCTALGLSGCQSIEPTSPDAAQMRFLDVSVDAPGLDVYVNGSGTAYGLEYGAVTSYVGVTPGTYTINANRASSAQALVTAKSGLASTRQYTAVVSNALANLQETIYPDQNVPAPAGMVAVRILNAAAGPGSVDVYLVPSSGSLSFTAPLVRGLGYTGDGRYINVPANVSYSLAVVAAGAAPNSANGLSHGATVSGGSGAVRTVVLSDAPPGSGRGVSAFVLNDLDPQ